MGVYYCFGCQESGDAITFIREVEHLDFVEAVERLAARAGITLRYDDVAVSARTASASSGCTRRSAAAIEFYHRLLLEAPDGGPARALSPQPRASTVTPRAGSQLGWSPDGYDALSVTCSRRSSRARTSSTPGSRS